MASLLKKGEVLGRQLREQFRHDYGLGWPFTQDQLVARLLENCTRANPTGAGDESLIEDLPINKTYLFRKPSQFALLKNRIFPEWESRGTKKLRLWSAGCSTGLEAFSLAITAQEYFGNLRGVQILGTDISRAAIAQALLGVCLKDEARRSLGSKWRRYFTDLHPGGKLCKLSDDLFTSIRFERSNLLSESQAGGPFDVIFCRHVLFYLDVSSVERVFRLFAEKTEPGAYLVTAGKFLKPRMLDAWQIKGPHLYRRA